VNSRFFDVLHDPGDDDFLSVSESVHIQLEGILEEAVDEDPGRPGNADRASRTDAFDVEAS